MNRDNLNRLRRMAGIPQDFSAEKKPIEEGAKGHMSSANVDNVAYPNMANNRVALDKQYNQYAFNTDNVEEEEVEKDEDFWDWTSKYPGEENEETSAMECPRCGEIELRSKGVKGGMDQMECDHCGHYEQHRAVKTEQEEDNDIFRDRINDFPPEDDEPENDFERFERNKERSDEIKDFMRARHEEKERPLTNHRRSKMNEAKTMQNTNLRFKKGQKVKVDGKMMVVEVPDAKADFVGLVPVGQEGNKDAVDLVRAHKIKVIESMHYHTDSNYSSHADDEVDPINVSADYETVFDHNQKMNDDAARDYQLTNDQTPVKVPPKILNDLKTTIDQLKDESERSKPRDFDRAYYYDDTAEAFQIVHDHLAMKTVEGLKRAQYYAHRMMNVQRALMPDHVWKFIVDGGVKRSLKSYMNNVQGSFPVAGEPAPTNDPAQLNKNTNTEI